MYDRYLIQPGEDINSIAKKFNIDEFTLMDINNISNKFILSKQKKFFIIEDLFN